MGALLRLHGRELEPNHSAFYKAARGAIKGQTVRQSCGSKQFPSERIRVGGAKFGPRLHEYLLWHPIEVFYDVLSGSAIVRDLAGSHEWQVNDGHRRTPFTVDCKTSVSSIDMRELNRMASVSFASPD